MNKISKGFVLILLGSLLILASCSNVTKSFSPEEVISNALEQSEQVSDSYYAEAEMIFYENEEIVERLFLKEWRTTDGKIRIESESDDEGEIIAVNNKKEMLTYVVDEKEVLIFDDFELLQINMPSPKEQALSLLEMIQETHDVETKGEDEVAGRKTFHIKAIPKKSSLLGEQDLWVDKESWMILKSIAVDGDSRDEIVYQHIDFNVQFDEDLFQLGLPDDVKKINIGNFGDTKQVSLTEGATILGESFWYIPTTGELEIHNVEISQMGQGDFEHIELTIEYKLDQLPYFSLSIFEAKNDLIETVMEGEEFVSVRSKEGLYSDVHGVKSFVWDEDGLRYSVLFHDPDMTVEQFVQLAENMELIESLASY